MEQKADGRENCSMSERSEKSPEFWVVVDEKTYSVNEVYCLLLTPVRLLIYFNSNLRIDTIREVKKLLSWDLVMKFAANVVHLSVFSLS